MDAYELMIKSNHHLIKGGSFTASQRNTVIKGLLSAESSSACAERFYEGVRYFGNTDNSGRRMYPIFFIPPYNDGKKLLTVLYQTPKTQLFSANMYELEILRLLCVLAPENDRVRQMTAQTLDRLKTTCFGYKDDGVGECFDASLVVLRFLAAAAPEETGWIKSRIDNYTRHADEKKRTSFSKWYFLLCLSELPADIAAKESCIKEILTWLNEKSLVMNSERDRSIHPVLFCIMRNFLSKFPEYEYIKERQPYVGGDGRLRFDMTR